MFGISGEHFCCRYDADGSRRSLAVAATNVTGKIFVVFIMRLLFWTRLILLPTPNNTK
jgi:hypothetical protein